MKLMLILVSLFMCQITYAQSVKEKKIKQEMLERVELLLEKISSTRKDLKKENVVSACEKINEMFVLYPAHVKAIGSYMDLYQGRTIRAKDQALHQLIFMHRKSLLCGQGKDSEYVNPKSLRKELVGIKRSLKKQKRIIKKSKTDHENNFFYHYEF